MSNPVKSNRNPYAPLEIPERFVEPEKAIVSIHDIGHQNPLFWAVKEANLEVGTELLEFNEDFLLFEDEPLCEVDAAYADRPNQYPSPEA